MVAKRIAAKLIVKNNTVVQPLMFDGLRVIGTPNEMARRYYEQGADELLIVDCVASLYQRAPRWDVLEAATEGVFIPVTYCGGIRSVADVEQALKHGADRVAVNTAAIARPALLTEIAQAFGSQALIVSIEAKRIGHGYQAYTDSGRQPSGKYAEAWAQEAVSLGAGEVLVTSVDRDGTGHGLDLDLVGRMRRAVNVPLLCGGGLRSGDDLVLGLAESDGAVAGAILHSDRADIWKLRAACGGSVRAVA